MDRRDIPFLYTYIFVVASRPRYDYFVIILIKPITSVET